MEGNKIKKNRKVKGSKEKKVNFKKWRREMATERGRKWGKNSEWGKMEGKRNRKKKKQWIRKKEKKT